MALSLKPEPTEHRTLVARTSVGLGTYLPHALIAAAAIALIVSAAVDIITARRFQDSLRVSRRWVVVSQRVADASTLAGHVGVPGNDVFVTRSAEREMERLHKAMATLRDSLGSVRRELSGGGTDAHVPDVLSRLDDAWVAALRLAADSERVLAAVARNEWDEAAFDMTAMDASNEKMNATFAAVNAAIAGAQESHYAVNQTRLTRLQRFRDISGLALVGFLVGGTALWRRFYYSVLERRLVAAAQGRAMAAAEYDADGRLLYANENFLRMTGYTLDELEGRHHCILVDQHTATSDSYREFWAALRAGESQRGRYQRVHKLGNPVWTQASYYPIRVGRGAPVKIVEYATDLTAEMQADRSRRALAAIVDASHDAIVGKNLVGAVTSWNAAAERLFGFTAAEIVGQSDERLLPPEGIAERAAVTEELRRGESGRTYETRKFRKNGTSIVVAISTFAVRDESGAVVGIGEIVRDVTERRQAEVALLHLKQALDEHSIVVTCDTDGKIVTVNDKFCATSKYSRAEIIGCDHRVVSSDCHPREFWHDLWKTVRAGRIWKGEIRNRAKDGAFYWADTTVVPVRDETGAIVHFVSVQADITERHNSAELLAQAAQEAEHRNEELARAHADALAATKAKSAFLASISHEIRTPMNAIIGMADLLAESVLQPHQEDYVRRLSRASASLLDLVNDVLDLSKIEAGRIAIESAPVDLHALLDDVSELLAIRVQEKRLEFVVAIHGGVPEFVVGDQTRLRQIILNLAGNAVKFTKRGEVAIRVEPVLDASNNPRVRFSVSDTGIGIPADKLERIFESFTQGDASTTRKYGGTGLGLSISKRLVGLMGGTLSVVSSPGCGSTFSFDIALESAGELQSHLPPAIVALRGKGALLVDHHETNRLATRARLEHLGLTVVEAADGVTALSALDEAQRVGRPPVVVFIEQDLPEMSGVTLAGAIRARSEWLGLPLVLYATEPRQGLGEVLSELGIADHFIKPITRRRLMAALLRAVSDTPHVAGLEPLTSASATPLRPVPMRVLVVEDAEENREVLAMYMKGDRYQVDLAENGAVGVERFLEGHYDIVLMDMQMPIMDGYQAAAAIRQWEREQQRTPVPIVAVTANAFPEDVERALAAGCTAHIAKPVRKAAVLAMLADYGHHQSTQAA